MFATPSCSTLLLVSVFEAEDSGVDDTSQTYFLQYFPESRESSAEFFSLSPSLANGDVLPCIKCFRNNQNIYAIAEPGMPRTVLEELIHTAKKAGGNTLYVVISCEQPNFVNMFKVLAYAGFKQVNPNDQNEICTASAVVAMMRL